MLPESPIAKQAVLDACQAHLMPVGGGPVTAFFLTYFILLL